MELLTIKNVCEMLKISRWTVAKMIDRGELKVCTVSKRPRFKREDIEALVNRNTKGA